MDCVCDVLDGNLLNKVHGLLHTTNGQQCLTPAAVMTCLGWCAGDSQAVQEGLQGNTDGSQAVENPQPVVQLPTLVH